MPNNASPPTNDAHSIIINYMKYLGYPSDSEGGVCNGFVNMGVQAVLANDADHFNQRIQVMLNLYQAANDSHSSEDERVKFITNRLAEVKEKRIKKHDLTDDEKYIAEIPAFCEGIELNQHTTNYNVLFDTPAEGQDRAKANTLLKPSKEDHRNTTFSNAVAGNYSITEFERYLSDFQDLINELKIPTEVSLFFGSPNHAIGASYHNGKWKLIDSNFAIESSKGIQEVESVSELARAIYSGFTPTEPTINLTTEIACSQEILEKNQLANDILTAWKKTPTWNNLHRRDKIDRYLTLTTSREKSTLELAFRKNDFETVDYLLKKKLLTIPLLSRLLNENAHSSKYLDQKFLSFLFKSGADPNFVANKNDLPIFHQAAMKSKGHMEEFLKAGANPNLRNEKGGTCLHLTTSPWYYFLVELLLKYGANINARDLELKTPLHFAIQHTNPWMAFKIVQRLLKNGADVNAVDINHNSPLHYAIQSGNPEIIKLLVDHHADQFLLNKKNETPLQSKPDLPKACLDLLDPNANDPNSPNRHTPSSGNMGEAPINISQATPLHLAIGKEGVDFPDLIEKNINHINAQDRYGNTPLHLACEASDKNAAKALLSEPNLNARITNNDNETPLGILLRDIPTNDETINLRSVISDSRGDIIFAMECAEAYRRGFYLLKNDTEQQYSRIGELIPLPMIAMEYNHLKYYLQLPGIDINTIDESGDTLFSYALNSFRNVPGSFIPPHIQLLLENGANPALTKHIHTINPDNHLLAERLAPNNAEASIAHSQFGIFGKTIPPSDTPEKKKIDGPS